MGGMAINFIFGIGERVKITVLNDIEGYISSASVNETHGITYYVGTGSKDTTDWYSEDFLISAV
jgi:hypothetical protein